MRKILSLVFAAIYVLMPINESHAHVADQPKYVFLFIGDGMGLAHIAATESYMSYLQGRLGGEHLVFTGFPVFGIMSTFSADKAVTCSAAAATAMACGVKTRNGYLGVGPDGQDLRSSAYAFKELGYRIGIITSVPINHATPAAFYANSRSRKDYYGIAMQIPSSGFDFFAGDGFLHFKGDSGNMKPVPDVLAATGIPVCYSIRDVEAVKDTAAQIVLSQPGSRDMEPQNYVLEDLCDDNMDLSGMLSACLDTFEDGEPFFIMCESGKIDWASHLNRTMPAINEVMALDDAVEVAYCFYMEHPDETLILVTSDHETGGLALGGPYETGSEIDWSVLEEGYVSDETSNREINSEANIGWTTAEHTGSYVPVFSIGLSAEKFGGKIDNTDIYSKLVP